MYGCQKTMEEAQKCNGIWNCSSASNGDGARMAAETEDKHEDTKGWSKLVFAAYVYWMWKARNAKIFEGVNMTVDALNHVILEEVRIKMAGNAYDMNNGEERRLMEERWGITIDDSGRRSSWVSWTKPPVGTVKLNTDGSLNNNKGAWGAALRDCEGNVLRAAHGVSPYTSIDAIEVDAVYQGMQLALRYGYRKIIINVDSTTAVFYIRRKSLRGT